jgi:hypothetical protein
MSNLGAYQMVTTGIKAMGGPGPAVAKAAGVIMLGGVIIFRTGLNIGARLREGKTAEVKLADWARAKFAQSSADELSEVHTVSADVECGGGLMLRAGDRFRVGKVIDDMVYIEVEGNDDNPFIVSAEQLTLHSDYPLLLKEEDGLSTGH